MNFTTFQLPWYVSRNMRRFRLIRNAFEIFEFYSHVLGGDFMSQGCDAMMFFQHAKICNEIEDVRQAAMTAGEFFLEILKMPDLTCALSLPGDEEDKTHRLEPLSKIYNDMRSHSAIEYVPSSCFDKTVQQYLMSPSNHFQLSLRVKGEAAGSI